MKHFNDIHYALAAGLCDDPMNASNYRIVAQTPLCIDSLRDAGFVIVPTGKRRAPPALAEGVAKEMCKRGFDASEDDARAVLDAAANWVVENIYPSLVDLPD